MKIFGPSIIDSSNISGSLFITGSIYPLLPANEVALYGTASWAVSASYVIGGGGGPETDPIFVSVSASLATTGSNLFIGNQSITGSLDVSGSFKLLINSTTPTNPPSDKGFFYLTDTDLYISLD